MTGSWNSKLYSDCYQLTINIFHRTKSYQKQLRPTLGRRAEDAALDLVHIVRLVSLTKKDKSTTKVKARLDEASQKLDEIKIVLQVAYDIHALSDIGYGDLSELTESIGKQIGGFIKSKKL
jgi:hypothetical protein